MDINTSLLKRQLSSKELVIVSVIGVLVIANLAIIAAVLFPEWKEVRDGKAAIAAKEQELQSVKSQYSSEQLSEENINDMLVRVPVKRTDSDNLVIFTKLASESKTMLGYLKEAAGSEDGNAAGSENGNGTVTSSYELLVLGHMPAIVDYMEKLQQHARLFSLEKWTASEMTRDAAAGDYPDLFSKAFIDKTKPVYAMQLTVKAYSFPQLQSAFGELDKK